MIDYAPYSLIEYLDISPLDVGDRSVIVGESFDVDSLYPNNLMSKNVHFSCDASSESSYYAIECSYADLPSSDLPRMLPFGGRYYYYWVYAVTDSNGDVIDYEHPFVLYRVLEASGASADVFERVSPVYTQDGAPPLPTVDDDGGVVSWLYHLGEKVYDSAVSLDFILGFGVGNYNFLYFILSNGFLIYMSICIVKFLL